MRKLIFLVCAIAMAAAALVFLTLQTVADDNGKVLKVGSEIVLTISATDPDNASLIYEASNLPEGANFDPVTHVFSWTPNYAQEGVYVVRFTVSDGKLSDYEDVTITVVQPYPDWDVNWDGSTNILDLIAIGQHFGETGTIGWSLADANQDGVVNVLDLIFVSNHF